MDRDDHVAAPAMEREMEGDPERDRPVPFDQGAVEVDHQHVLGPDLLPEEEPGVAEQGVVGLAVGDVPGQVVVVPLPPEGAREQHQLLARGEIGKEVGRRRREVAVAHGRRSGGSGHR